MPIKAVRSVKFPALIKTTGAITIEKSGSEFTFDFDPLQCIPYDLADALPYAAGIACNRAPNATVVTQDGFTYAFSGTNGYITPSIFDASQWDVVAAPGVFADTARAEAAADAAEQSAIDAADASRLTLSATVLSAGATPTASITGVAGSQVLNLGLAPGAQGPAGANGTAAVSVYTFATIPSASSLGAGSLIYISDERYGTVACYSDGTRWRRVFDERTAQSAVINYYIDGTSGNDLNAGTSSGAPIKTLTQLQTLVNALPVQQRSGLRFAFARNTSIAGRWELGANNFGCIFEAYGTETLPRPMFDCADVLTNASFAVDGSFANCYNITITPTIESASAECPGVWVDGERYSYVATKTLCNAHPYTFTHSNPDGLTSLVLTVNSGSNPAVDGKVYEASIRASAINTVAADECEFRDLHGKRNYGSYGPFALGNHQIADRLLCEDGCSHNIYYGAYSVLRDVVALNCNYGVLGSATMFIGFDNPVKPNAWSRLERCKAICTENSLKPKSAVTAVGAASPATVTVTTGHSFVIGDYVMGESVGGATWVNGVRWYVSNVAGDVLTIQKHDYTANRVQSFNASALSAWTSGGFIKLAPPVTAVGFYSHGPADGVNVWESVTYDRCESRGCSVPFSAADARRVDISKSYLSQFSIAYDAAAYTSMFVNEGLAENTPAVVGALSSRIQSGGKLYITNYTFIINSTGNHQLSGTGGTTLEMTSVRHEGFSSLVRGLAADHVVKMQRVVNVPNVNISQSNLLNFNGSTTGLVLESDFNDFGAYAGGFTIVGTAHANLAAYQAATLQDLNSKP